MHHLRAPEASREIGTVSACVHWTEPDEMRQRLKRTADRLGLRSHVRKVRRVVGSPTTRRAIRDDDHLFLLLAFALKSTSSCIDVGSAEGAILKEILRVAPHGRHIAYEPLPALAENLRRRFPTVDVRCAALAREAGLSTFVHVIDRPDYSGLRIHDYPGNPRREEIVVQVEALDDALRPGYVPDLIKIDVEGAEQGVIEGAMRTITTHRPIIVFEHGARGAPHYNTRPGDIHRLLCREVGLHIFDLDGNGPYSLDQFEATFERRDRWNFVARP